MLGIAGLLIVFIMVFGGYTLAGGKMEVIIHSLPYEMMIIGGSAVGTFLLGNEAAIVKATGRDIIKVFKGPKWKPDDYRDLLCLLFSLIRIARQNPVAIEEHIEAPDDSPIFQKYPRILSDHEAIEIICDTMRNASMNYDDPNQVEEVIDKQLETNHQHALHTSHALQAMADGLPALGIVAAVLGVIKTMSAIDKPPEILGKMIGGALVGTFLGVFMAYGLVAPLAQRLKSLADEDSQFYKLIREVLVANLHNHATNVCIEVGRQNTPHHIRPSFSTLEDAMRALKQESA